MTLPKPDDAQRAGSHHTKNPNASRAVWLKNLHQWHWISSALCLLGMLLFSFTGITLNHATQIESKPAITSHKATLPAPLLANLRKLGAEQVLAANKDNSPPLPLELRQWAAQTWSLQVPEKPAEWSQDEVYLPMPRPGGDAWLRIGLADGAAEMEVTDRGWISWLNDMHKGRNAGAAWSWFIDIFAIACLVFSLTGLLILKFHASNRPLTWPMVGMGLLIPALLALLFVH